MFYINILQYTREVTVGTRIIIYCMYIGEFQIKILKKHVLIVVYSTCRYFLRLHIRLMYNVKKTNPKGKVIKKLFFISF